ncbi:MAG: nicotinate (nicotinamide) nucleotide adenylyltransferase [Verrucomicrobia bacterium]|nr:MAG: nicotinate (nicotinamide) nucleotide adenylyltransferase [Verrucomicrobiota bacterium]
MRPANDRPRPTSRRPHGDSTQALPAAERHGAENNSQPVTVNIDSIAPAPGTRRRLGLYGGSFDPVHIGHLLVAQAALEELGLDRIVFIPAAQSPFKPDSAPAPASQRLRWLRMALAGWTNADVDDLETRRAGTSYSIDTVRKFAARHPGTELFWLIGTDHVPTLPQWRDANELARLVTFVVIPRPGCTRAELPAPYRLRTLRGWPLAVSSSELRGRIAAGQTIAHLVPPGIAEAIAGDRAYPRPD